MPRKLDKFEKEIRSIIVKFTTEESGVKDLTIRTEWGHLLLNHRKICREILEKDEIDEADIANFLVSLHIVLEVGLNSFFRTVILSSIKKELDEFEVSKNLDGISFLHKSIMFIYNSKFNFSKDLDKATKYNKIIGTLMDFSKYRNQLLHGHSLAIIVEKSNTRKTELLKALNSDVLKEQINKFKFIMEGMSFYLNCLDSELKPERRKNLINEYLDAKFLEIDHKEPITPKNIAVN